MEYTNVQILYFRNSHFDESVSHLENQIEKARKLGYRIISGPIPIPSSSTRNEGIMVTLGIPKKPKLF